MSEPWVLMLVTSHGDIGGVPTTGIWFSEFAEPFAYLRERGARVVVVSPRGGPAPVDPRGYPDVDTIAGAREALAALNATLAIERVDAADYDGLFLPGGHGPMFDLAGHAPAKSLIRAFADAGKPVAAVCHGPAGLLAVPVSGRASLLEGQRVTGFTPEEDAADPLFQHMPFSLAQRMRAEGAEFVAGPAGRAHVERCGTLVTGQNPVSALPTAEVFFALLSEARRA